MKKQILINLIVLSSIFTMNAQIEDTGDKVGIGTAFPMYKLDVNGVGRFGEFATIGTGVASGYYQDASNGAYRSLNVNGNTGYYFQNYNGISTIMFVGLQGSYTGNIGIGTATPSYKLDIQGSGINAGIHLKKTDGVSSSWYLHPGRLGNGEFSIGDELEYRLVINNQGNIGIGTVSPSYKLDVIGTIRAREIKVDLNGADFVFEETYKLMPLNELEKFVKDKKHLPEIESANEMEKNGTDLGVLTSKLLQKIEELTLYTIDQNKKIIELEKQNKVIEELKQVLKIQNEKIEKIKSDLK